MKYIEKNNIKISQMTLGTVQLGMAYGVNNSSGMPSEEDSFKILNSAYENGVTILDTSDDYGKSEEVIGKFIKANPNKQFDICTKFKVTESTAKDIYQSLKSFALSSAKKLNIERIPLFMSHTEQNFIDYGSKLTDALDELKKEGIIINSGISLSRKNELKRIADTGKFDAVQIPMNIFDNKEIIDGTVKNISESGVAVFVRSVYLQGLFFKTKEMLQNTNLCVAIPYIEKLNEIASNNNLTVAELALSFIRDSEGVDSLVIGSETVQQVEHNTRLFNTPPLNKIIIEDIYNEFANIDPFIISPWEWAKHK